MELILLGTGVPRPTTLKSGPANAIVYGEKLYLVDAARNVTTQIFKAGFSLGEVDHLLFTHFHHDHYTGFGEFFLARWMMLAKTPLRVFGPPPVEEIVRRMLHYYEYDIEIRVGEGKKREGSEIEVTVLLPGDSFELDGIKICVEEGTYHGNIDILSYCFEADGRKIVIASDGSPTEKLVPFAKGADILLMHPIIPDLFDEKFGGVRSAADRVASKHASAEGMGRTATEAGVGHLVFSHVLPGNAPNEKVKEEISRYFDGTIIAGEDLLRL